MSRVANDLLWAKNKDPRRKKEKSHWFLVFFCFLDGSILLLMYATIISNFHLKVIIVIIPGGWLLPPQQLLEGRRAAIADTDHGEVQKDGAHVRGGGYRSRLAVVQPPRSVLIL